jgi:hypothetical protein
LGSEDEQRTSVLINQLVLDVKAISLLHQSDPYLGEALRAAFSESPDEDVRRFFGLIQVGRRPTRAGYLVMAVGELVFASLLVFVGLISLAPSLLGLSSPRQLVDYIVGYSLAPVASVLAPFLSLIEFSFALLLLLSAFYTLRQASKNLKGAGFTLKGQEL